MAKSKFRARYVLGTGFPWPMGLAPYKEIVICDTTAGRPLPLRWPEELWGPDVPRYRLVLERVDKPRGKP